MREKTRQRILAGLKGTFLDGITREECRWSRPNDFMDLPTDKDIVQVTMYPNAAKVVLPGRIIRGPLTCGVDKQNWRGFVGGIIYADKS